MLYILENKLSSLHAWKELKSELYYSSTLSQVVFQVLHYANIPNCAMSELYYSSTLSQVVFQVLHYANIPNCVISLSLTLILMLILLTVEITSNARVIWKAHTHAGGMARTEEGQMC